MTTSNQATRSAVVDLRAFLGGWLRTRLDTTKRLARKIARGADAETIHELRITCRRLRAATDVFAPLLPARAARRLERAARATMRALAPLREADVALERLPLLGGPDLEPPLARERARFEKAARAERRLCARRARSEIERRSRRLVARLGKLTKKLEARPAARPPIDVEGFFDAEIATRTAAVARRLRGLTDRSPADDLHALRIAIKRLRYAAALAAGALPDPRYEAVERALAPIQDRAGAGQDLADLCRRIEKEGAPLVKAKPRRAERVARLAALTASARRDEARAFLEAARRAPMFRAARQERRALSKLA